MKKIKFAIIGAGHIGKRHAGIISENASAELTAIIDVRSKAELGLEHLNVPFFSSRDKFFKSYIETDVAIIATPNSLHKKHAIQCLNNDLHVAIEKPFALKGKHVQQIINKAKEVKKHVFTIMQNRYSPSATWLKKNVEENVLGKIFMVQVNCFWNRDERYYQKDSWHTKRKLDGGTLFTQFSHFIDILYWIFGDIKNIKSKLLSFNHRQLTDFEDTGIINFDFVKEGTCSFNYTTSVWDKNLESNIIVIAEKGTVKIGGQYMDRVEYCHIKNDEIPIPKSDHANNDISKLSFTNHQCAIENIIHAINGQSSINADAYEALKIVDIIERIYKTK